MEKNQEMEIIRQPPPSLSSELAPAIPNNQIFTNPQLLGQMIEFSKLLSRSEMVPKDFKDKPGNTLVAIQMGMEIGLAPMQAIQNISVINGRPCVWGDAMLAVVQNSGKLEWIKEWTEGDTAYCQTKRKGYPEPYTNTFSDADAKAANLLSKPGPWTTSRARMRQMRARAFNLRDQYADVLRGLNSGEEVSDYSDLSSPVPASIRSENSESGPALKTSNAPAPPNVKPPKGWALIEDKSLPYWTTEHKGKFYIFAKIGEYFDKDFLWALGFTQTKGNKDNYFRQFDELFLLKLEQEFKKNFGAVLEGESA